MVVALTIPPNMVAMNPTPCRWIPRFNDFDVDIVKEEGKSPQHKYK
jgi:hypothetical protein